MSISEWVCLPLCGFGFGVDISKARARVPEYPGNRRGSRDTPTPITLRRGGAVRPGASTSTWHTPAHALLSRRSAQPRQASKGGNASRGSRLSPPPRGRSTAPALPLRPLRPWRRRCRPGPPGWASCGGCDSGLSQAEAGCQRIHWATRNLTGLFIGRATAGPAPRRKWPCESREWEQRVQDQGAGRPPRPLHLPQGLAD